MTKSFSLHGQPVFAATGGKPLNPDLPPVLFVHGAGLDHSVWALHTRYFSHHGRTVLAVDLPGHGRSGGTPLTSIEAMADWLADLIASLSAGAAAVVGHSMGSLVALETAARHPDLVRALGLIGTAPSMPVHPDLLNAARDKVSAAIDMVTDWGYGQRANLGGSRAPGVWMNGDGRRLLERAAPGVLHADLAACNAYQNGLAAAAKVQAPTVLVLGEKDRMTPAKAGKALADVIPGSRTVVLRGAGHMLMAEEPDAVLDALIGTV